MSAKVRQKRYNDESLTSSDSDEYHKVFFSSSSHDRSSVGSIPWAEDAIKQNQQEWERIERMFYGEEDLPENDQELRREIIEWTKAFPHLRIVGRKISPIEADLKHTSEADNRKQGSEVSFENSLPSIDNSFNKSFIIHPEAKSIFLDLELSRLLERDLRINSVPMVSRRRNIIEWNATQRGDIALSQFNKTHMPTPTTPKKLMRRQIYPCESLIPSTCAMDNNPKIKAAKTSKSARIVRMPPIVNFILPPQTKYLPTGSATSHYLFSPTNPSSAHRAAASTRLHQPLVLPLLKLNRKDQEDASNRSISAALNEEKIRTMFLTNSASKLKTAK